MGDQRRFQSALAAYGNVSGVTPVHEGTVHTRKNYAVTIQTKRSPGKRDSQSKDPPSFDTSKFGDDSNAWNSEEKAQPTSDARGFNSDSVNEQTAMLLSPRPGTALLQRAD